MSLGDERLTTTDKKGRRIFLYPAEVRGFFRKYRTITQAALIIFFLVLPWITVDGQQLLLLDISNKTFHFFGLNFKAHDAPMIFLVLAVLTIGIALLTALLGRVWCGWACPQTVFIDGVYRKIEVWIQGNYIQRRKLSKEGWTPNKISKISLTWVAYFIVSTLIAHSFVSYFVGSQRLIQMIQGTPQENWAAFLIVMSMTGVLMFDFGWFREQFCIIACPYGRFQAALMDKKSISVVYDYNRGEPRKDPSVPKNQQGDCVSCRRCVEVCPTGIDIRRGIQMECIGCTACIDACDEIMEKVNKPLGLIRYGSEHELETKSKPTWISLLTRPRVVLYSVILFAVMGILSFLIQNREPIMVSVLKVRGAPYSKLVEGSISYTLNHFKLHVHNQSSEEMIVFLSADDDVSLVVPQNNIRLSSNSSREVHFFAKFKEDLSKENKGSLHRALNIEAKTKKEVRNIIKDLTLVGPI